MNIRKVSFWWMLLILSTALNARNVSKSEALLHFAEKNNINVEDNEVESLFIQELGDHPKVVTDGKFDPAKFEDMKQTAEVKKILKEMKKDILISKTESVVRKQFELSYDELLKMYTAENSNFNIRYCITDVEDMNVPEGCSTEEAFQYYLHNQDEFMTEEKIKLQIVPIPKSEFEQQATEITEQLFDSIPENADIPSDYKVSVFQNELKKATENKALRIKNHLQRDEPVFYMMFDSGFIAKADALGEIPQELITNAFTKPSDKWFTYFDEGFGSLIFKVTDRKAPEKAEFEDVTNDIWKSYIEHKKSDIITDKDELYFYQNLSEYISSAVVTDIIEIPRPYSRNPQSNEPAKEQLRIIQELQESDTNTVSKKYNLKITKKVIYLDKYDNNDTVLNEIADEINSGNDQGFVYRNYDTFMFATSSYFPEYIPDFASVRDQIEFPDAVADTTMYRQMFETNKRRYSIQDSLKLGGVFFEANIDSISVPQIDVYNYYKENLKSYYYEDAVRFDYIYISDSFAAHSASNKLNSGADFKSVKYCFNEKEMLFPSGFIDVFDLPLNLANTLQNTNEGNFTEPVAYSDGFLLLRKIQHIKYKNLSFEEVKTDINTRLSMDAALKKANMKAKAFFDSSSYYSHCRVYADSSEIFQTSYLSADSEFEKIGKITKQRKALLRLWKYEKFSSIFGADTGSAVVFMLKKNQSRKMTFEEAIPVIRKNISEKMKAENAVAFFNEIRNKISTGSNGDSLLIFWGGWKEAKNLNTNSKISGLDFDDSVMAEISKHKEGYLSHTIKLPGNKLFLYKVTFAKEINLKFFNDNFKTLKRKNQQRLFNKWINIYKAENF